MQLVIKLLSIYVCATTSIARRILAQSREQKKKDLATLSFAEKHEKSKTNHAREAQAHILFAQKEHADEEHEDFKPVEKEEQPAELKGVSRRHLSFTCEDNGKLVEAWKGRATLTVADENREVNLPTADILYGTPEKQHKMHVAFEDFMHTANPPRLAFLENGTPWPSAVNEPGPDHDHVASLRMGRDVIVIVHAFGGSPKKFWYPVLCKHFDSNATVVVVPHMPGGTTPVVGEWLFYLQTTIQKATTQEGANLYLVGHSLGCNAILRMLAAEPEAAATLRCLRGVLCVAGWLSIDEPWLEMEPWCHPRPDLAAARRTLESLGARLTLLVSDNDRFTRDHESNRHEWRCGLGARTVLCPGRAHWGGRKQPAILGELHRLMGRKGVQGDDTPPATLITVDCLSSIRT